MVEPSRYNVSQNGANLDEGILKNKLNIKDQELLEDHETLLIADAYDHFFGKLENDELTFNTDLIFGIHRYFLLTLYDWAGQIRKVDISKSGVLFCQAVFIEDQLKNLDHLIKENIPRDQDGKNEVSKKLAIIHNEFNAIHPFRDGNGRTIRLFIDLIAVQQGYQLVDYKKSGKETYLKACADGMVMNHESMAKVFNLGLTKFKT